MGQQKGVHPLSSLTCTDRYSQGWRGSNGRTQCSSSTASASTNSFSESCRHCGQHLDPAPTSCGVRCPATTIFRIGATVTPELVAIHYFNGFAPFVLRFGTAITSVARTAERNATSTSFVRTDTTSTA